MSFLKLSQPVGLDVAMLLSNEPMVYADCAPGFRAQVKLLLSEVLLPALCMVPANVGLVNDVWGALHLLEYTDRWRIYNSLKVGAAGPQGASQQSFLNIQ